MSLRKDYKILPQSERDKDGYINGGRRPSVSSSSSCCLISLATVAVLLILIGTTALTIGLFYSTEFSQIVNQYFWHQNSTNALDNIVQSTTRLPTSTTVNLTTTISSNSSLFEDDDDENGNSTLISPDFGGNGTSTSKEMEEFAEFVKNFEKYMEQLTGIKRAEFVVPLFMLICFLSSVTLVSLCCCLCIRRREMKRRKLLGKIITDLQSGDSKTVLLNDDGDD